MMPNDPQGPPREGYGEDIYEAVIRDIAERTLIGRKKYGCSLKAFNGRDALKDAYQEALDLVMYLRQLMDELESIKMLDKVGVFRERMEANDK